MGSMASSAVFIPQGDTQNGNNTIVSTWLPDFIGWLKDAGKPGKPRLQSECSICYQLLDISTDVGDWFLNAVRRGVLVTEKDVYAHMQLEPTAVLPCGHVIGSECLAKWTRTAKQCPICRRDIACHHCEEKVLAPLCAPFRTLDGVYGFCPYEAIVRDIPWTEGESRGRGPGKIYCGPCVSQQAVLLMSAIFVGNEACSLCRAGGGAHETAEGHRFMRDFSADRFVQEKLKRICVLLRPSRGMRPSELDARRQHGDKVLKDWAYGTLLDVAGVERLKRRIFRDCSFLGETAGALTPQDVYDLSMSAMFITRICHDTDKSPISFTNIDELMVAVPV
ncbi:hypothetical protein PG993_008418 [Apiospora rasikravindrae]|uniref:RING-type domain-containing protein n=1 Tax=Apiospora rasikravindrae TaxID=990691 RepID=A0ABR1T0A3_9PEZI